MEKWDESLPLVSVYIATYGQEKYISEAIDSVLMQKTEFKFEILVGEDASPDGTRKILQEYEKKYPGRFYMLYLDENTYSTENNVFVQLRNMCKGKYIICLEGDDFWIDEHKLQKQAEFLETHADAIAVAHRCVVVDKDSKPTKENYPECLDQKYTIRHFMSNIMPGQFTTVMMINPKYHPQIDWSLMRGTLRPGDRLLYYTLITNGNVYCMREKMTAYRHIKDGGTSFSANWKYDYKKSERWERGVVEYAYKNGGHKQICFAELNYFVAILQGIKYKQATIDDIRKNEYVKSGKLHIVFLYFIRFIRIHIFHCKLYI